VGSHLFTSAAKSKEEEEEVRVALLVDLNDDVETKVRKVLSEPMVETVEEGLDLRRVGR
jgi:hypothetical protein